MVQIYLEWSVQTWAKFQEFKPSNIAVAAVSKGQNPHLLIIWLSFFGGEGGWTESWILVQSNENWTNDTYDTKV